MINNYFQEEYKSYHKVYEEPRLHNFIYLGDVNSALDNQFIVSCNIKTVVTAASNMQHINYDSSINHIVYSILDAKSQQISKFFIQFCNLIDSQILRGSILVHCAAGVSRSATLVIAYIMKKFKYSFRQAIEFVRKERPTICPNYGFEMQLKEFQRYLQRQTKKERFYDKDIPKTSQANKHSRVNQNDQRELPEIVQINMRKTQLKGRNMDPGLLLKIPNKSSQLSRQSYRQQLYDSKKANMIPVLKPRSLSYIQKKGIQRKKQLRDKIDPIEYIKSSIIAKLGLNDHRMQKQKIPHIRTNRKHPSNLYF